MKIIRVIFGTDYKQRDYAYFTDDDTIEVGDTVVVDAPSSGLTCVKVVSLTETVESVERVGKWIVQKVDTKPYCARLEKEGRRKVLRAKIERAKEEALDAMALKEVAAISPELAAMVEELKGL